MMMEVVLRNRLREFRLLKGLTQSQLAYKCGTSKNTISNIERGVSDPSVTLAAIICFQLDCYFYDIFYLEEVDNGRILY